MRKERIPDIRFDVNLVSHGYEWRLFLDGKEVDFSCRDFGGNHRVKSLQHKFLKLFLPAIESVVEEWRAKL